MRRFCRGRRLPCCDRQQALAAGRGRR
jgi:hypothetical protein